MKKASIETPLCFDWDIGSLYYESCQKILPENDAYDGASTQMQKLVSDACPYIKFAMREKKRQKTTIN